MRSILEKNFKNFLNIVFYEQNFNRLISLTNRDKNERMVFDIIIYSLLHNVTACHLSMKNFWQHRPLRRDLVGFKVGSRHEKKWTDIAPISEDAGMRGDTDSRRTETWNAKGL